MRIGELASSTGVSIRSLRYYEEQGLIQPVRMANGYREYSPFAAEQVRTVQFYLSLGLTTEQIAGFLQCVMKNKEAFCAEVLPLYEKKLAEMNEQIELLTRIRSNLIERIEAIREEQQSTQRNGGIPQ
ncbi:MerR family transcriptional regulator [Paenibacillus sp. S-38]|uniref:MerR family transcriptional regulator n=1 Tax=Paenibacillus sp. S-38 TaxID=3416710 RepID=UPI003CFA906C